VTLTATDLFAGAGGSSLGAEDVPGVRLVMAANHWDVAIDVHQQHFPHAGHDRADISCADPRRYPATDLLIASPECTNHSQARGVSRHRQDPSLWDAPDPSAERSRSTMWDVPRFAEQNRYAAGVVENVVEVVRWVGWNAWCTYMTDLGYEYRVLSLNSMHFGVPQSRDRVFIAWWRRGLPVELDLESTAWCTRCDRVGACRQAWKNGRRVGRYRQQWVWTCSACATTCDPEARPAADILDWSLPCPRIGDRLRPLAAATRARILAGLQRYGWAPVITAGAGNVYETTPGNRARPLDQPLAVQQASATHALATPPGAFALNTAHGGRIHDLDDPHPTVCASDDRLSLVVPLRRNGRPWPTDGPIPTVAAGANHHALVMRNNAGGAEMVTPAEEPVRTVTTKGHQSLLVPYYGTGQARSTDEPAPTVTTRDRCAVVDPEAVVDDCGFRMLEPHEIAAAMAFPAGYIPGHLPKKHQVKLAGNAVTPPVMTWIVGRLARALEGVA
jgi:DNA (cytosine-5)-methyltransferase 1